MKTHDLEEMRERLRVALFQARIDPTSLSLSIGRGKDYLRDFLNGRKASLSAAAISDLESALGLPPLFLTGGPKPQRARSPNAKLYQAVDAAATLSLGLNVFEIKTIDSGDFVISVEPIDVVPRPWFLIRAKDSYGLIIDGDDMSPAYEGGDMVFVNPKLPILEGKDAVYTAAVRGGQTLVKVRRCIGSTTEDWLTSKVAPQLGGKGREKLPRKIWKAARIVGKYASDAQ